MSPIEALLRSHLPEVDYSLQREVCEAHGSDYTEDLLFLPEAVAWPRSAQQVADLLKDCNMAGIPVYTRGAGTGLSGACLPVKGGLVLSTRKLNAILEIDTKNAQARVQPGVINAELKAKAQEFGLWYAPDPASFQSSTIGGNIAHGAGGPKAVKYGTTREHILNLQVALPNGDLIWTGADTLKNATGFSLTQLMIGSEGLLGIVTEAVVKLVRKPAKEKLMLACFAQSRQAALAVNGILNSVSNLPAALELMEKRAVQISKQATQTAFPEHQDAEYYLLIAIEGELEEELMHQSEELYGFLDQSGALEVWMPQSSQHQEDWWKVRRAMGEAVKQISIYKEEDAVVPRAALPELLTGLEQIRSHYGFETVSYGHAGDGNLHINILKSHLSDEEWKEEVPKGIKEIFKLCKELGGTLSGEHGVGLVQAPYLSDVLDPGALALMRGIKAVFDPNGILNPGKWV
ncbi:MAG: FAD-binding protein [Bacteroidetes bacterium]|nr:FAD-binding protein [Bacteroidota bacterium]MDA0943347.1 FAD-binding protein [Bacteroidota bacterium]MDA1111039.1 FAD-binding protein [Bacteroidota bacterium]